jgi:hypothetical protein
MVFGGHQLTLDVYGQQLGGALTFSFQCSSTSNKFQLDVITRSRMATFVKGALVVAAISVVLPIL